MFVSMTCSVNFPLESFMLQHTPKLAYLIDYWLLKWVTSKPIRNGAGGNFTGFTCVRIKWQLCHQTSLSHKSCQLCRLSNWKLHFRLITIANNVLVIQFFKSQLDFMYTCLTIYFNKCNSLTHSLTISLALTSTPSQLRINSMMLLSLFPSVVVSETDAAHKWTSSVLLVAVWRTVRENWKKVSSKNHEKKRWEPQLTIYVCCTCIHKAIYKKTFQHTLLGDLSQGVHIHFDNNEINKLFSFLFLKCY